KDTMLQNIRVRTKIRVLVVSLLAFIGATGAFAVSRLRDMASHSRDLSETRMPAARMLDTMQEKFLMERILTLRTALTPAEAHDNETAIASEWTDIDGLWAKLAAFHASDVEAARTSAIRDKLSRYRTLQRAVVATARGGGRGDMPQLLAQLND